MGALPSHKIAAKSEFLRCYTNPRTAESRQFTGRKKVVNEIGGIVAKGCRGHTENCRVR